MKYKIHRIKKMLQYSIVRTHKTHCSHCSESGIKGAYEYWE